MDKEMCNVHISIDHLKRWSTQYWILHLFYALIHLHISFGVAFFPYNKMPVWKIFPASFIINHTLIANMAMPIAISTQGHSSNIERRMRKTPGEVTGM